LATPSALLKNQQGNVVGPTEEFVLAAQNNKTFDKYMFQNFLNSDDPQVRIFFWQELFILRLGQSF
jgi:hypothetical protein